jgi:serine acetyltransferase
MPKPWKQPVTNLFHEFSVGTNVKSLSVVNKPTNVKIAGIKAAMINTSQNVPEFLNFNHSALNAFI